MTDRSKLVRMKITNLGCIDATGLTIDLDNIVCLVGVNNCGKSTVLQAYESAVNMATISPDQLNASANGQPATVELWVHIPKGVENIDEKWKEASGSQLLVRSKWEWQSTGGKPIRYTWDPCIADYAVDGKASGLDTVFNSRLPKPFRIGSLEDPTAEHKKLLELVLEPIEIRLTKLMGDEDSELKARIKDLQSAAEKPVKDYSADLTAVQQRVSKSYRRVFSTSDVQLTVSLGELAIDPHAALVRSSRIEVVESHGLSHWNQQGTGSQRALFWSMLEVRSELNRLAEERRAIDKQIKDTNKDIAKKEKELSALKQATAIARKQAEIQALRDELTNLKPTEGDAVPEPTTSFLPGYMLLIDEPETALHPSAVRAAKEYLYSLASESGWQVMLSTHHPSFVDPLKDHTTIVRLHREAQHRPPNLYRTDDISFTGDEKDNLKALLAFDSTVAEMFFASRVVIVEGDTEFAAFTEVMDADPINYPIETRPLILRARGKATISILVKMLAHFKVNMAVLHDIDSPMTSGGARRNGAYTTNKNICEAIEHARSKGVHIIHRVSCPNFERQHKLSLADKDKPFEAWRAIRSSDPARESVRSILAELCTTPDDQCHLHADDGKSFEAKLKSWANVNATDDPAYKFATA